MGELTCDDCGTINDDSRPTCELCGASLAQEEKRQRAWLAPIAWIGVAVFLFLFFLGDHLWWRATRRRYPHDRAGGLELIEVLAEPSGLLVVAGLLTAVALIAMGVARHVTGNDA